MGSIKRLRKTYQTPSHPWQKDRIVEEKSYLKEYGLKNKTEIWKMTSILANFKALSKRYLTENSDQARKESELLLSKLKEIGFLGETALLSDVLTLVPKDIFERRLQTIVFRKGLARSVNQARQFITHGHIKLNGVAISSPSYLVRKSEEENITFTPTSALADMDHPERSTKKTEAPAAESSEAPVEETAPQTEGKKE